MVFVLSNEVIGCYLEHPFEKDSYNVDTQKDFDSMIGISRELIDKGKELYPSINTEEIEDAIENHIISDVKFKLTGLSKTIGYDKAYKILKESKLAKEYKKVIYKEFFSNQKHFYFTVFSIYIDRKYIKINIFGIQINIKLKTVNSNNETN